MRFGIHIPAVKISKAYDEKWGSYSKNGIARYFLRITRRTSSGDFDINLTHVRVLLISYLILNKDLEFIYLQLTFQCPTMKNEELEQKWCVEVVFRKINKRKKLYLYIKTEWASIRVWKSPITEVKQHKSRLSFY